MAFECGKRTGDVFKLAEEIGSAAEVPKKPAGGKASEETDLQEQLGAELIDMLHEIVAIAAVDNMALTKSIPEKDKKASVK